MRTVLLQKRVNSRNDGAGAGSVLHNRKLRSSKPSNEFYPIRRDRNEKFSVLESAKPKDTEGVKMQGTVPNEIQFLTDVVNDARDALIESVKEKAAGLPEKTLEQARKHASESDSDSAAEFYILYLNSTFVDATPER
jgi:hypothetical protein